jgi:DNA recombination protein RmuC
VDPLVYLLLGLVLGALLGGWIGWLLGLRRGVASRAEDPLLTEFRQQLARGEAQATELRGELGEVRTRLATAEAAHQAAERLLADQKELHDRQLGDLRLAQEKAVVDLREAFKALSADALRQTQPEFLRLATETLARFQETAKGDLTQRQQAIVALLDPLRQQLEIYQQRLQQSETAQNQTLGEVRQHLETLAQQSLTLSNETLQLRRVLSSSQARGRWGEETLRRVVEAAGMSAHCDFSEQIQAGDAKPDLLVHLPGGRLILVDAKVPDLEFLEALEEADELKRREALVAHAAKLKGTIKSLADRDYPGQFPGALDYVVLFLPAESLFSAALEGDRDLIVWAAHRRILLATPASLIALLRSVSVSWQQQAQTENARSIATAAAELYQRVAKFAEHLERLRAGLERAVGAYNEAVGSYERMVRPSGERLLRLSGGLEPREIAGMEYLEKPLRDAPVLELDRERAQGSPPGPAARDDA